MEQLNQGVCSLLQLYCIVIGSIILKDVDTTLLTVSGSNWGVEHAANVGIRWNPEMKLPEAHPAICYGTVPTMKGITFLH